MNSSKITNLSDEQIKQLSPRLNEYIPIEPTAKQTAFLLLNDIKEVLFGGSAGGGKSVTLLMAALQYVDCSDYAALLIRKNFHQLDAPGGLIEMSKDWLSSTDAEYSAQRKEWTFPSGAKLRFGHLSKPDDKRKYQGSEYQYIGFDEVTDFRESSYRFLFSRLRRLKGSQIPIRMRCASNPVGRGLDWVRQRFITADRYDRAFVPASVEDNPHLDTKEYKKTLQALDPVTRKKILEGDWSEMDKGKIFDEDNTQFVPDLPEMKRVVRYWDFATSPVTAKNPDPDYAAGVLFGKGTDNTYYVIDARRRRGTSDEIEQFIKQTAFQDGRDVPITIEQEPGSQSEYAIDYYVTDVLNGWNVHVDKVNEGRTNQERGKTARASPLSSQWRQGNVKIKEDAWNEKFIDEFESFPDGKHDDWVDACSGAFNWLNQKSAKWHFL